jgi:hypothetical protein
MVIITASPDILGLSSMWRLPSLGNEEVEAITLQACRNSIRAMSPNSWVSTFET